MFELGDRVSCKITGFTGIIIGKSEWLNGCATYGIQTEDLKDGMPQKVKWFDEPQLRLQTKKVLDIGDKDGGPIVEPERCISPLEE